MNDEKFKAFCESREWNAHQDECDKKYWFQREGCVHDVDSVRVRPELYPGSHQLGDTTCGDCDLTLPPSDHKTFVDTLILECQSLRARLDAQQKQIDELKGER